MEDFFDHLKLDHERWGHTCNVPKDKESYVKGLIDALSFCEKVAPAGSVVTEGFILQALPFIKRIETLK